MLALHRGGRNTSAEAKAQMMMEWRVSPDLQVDLYRKTQASSVVNIAA